MVVDDTSVLLVVTGLGVGQFVILNTVNDKEVVEVGNGVGQVLVVRTKA